MRTLTRRTKVLAVLILFVLANVLCGIVISVRKIGVAQEMESAYIELYSPLNETDISMSNANYLNATVVDNDKTPSGKGLQLDYKLAPKSVEVSIPAAIKKDDGYKGLAIWVDIPKTADEYSFTMYIAKSSSDWQVMNVSSELTLLHADGTVEKQASAWKRQMLNGFTGWVIMPDSAYSDSAPEKGKMYTFVIMIENETDAYKTEAMTMTVGSIGYYTNYDALLYEIAETQTIDAENLKKIDSYISQIALLQPESQEQTAIKNKMMVYFTNIRENFLSLPLADKVEIMNGVYAEYYTQMQKYLYGEVRAGEFVMSFAVMSDTHFLNTWNNDYFEAALMDAHSMNPDLAGVFVLGDLSDNGVSTTTEKNTDLDNYYDWIDSFEFKNSKGEAIPFTSVLGNHDVRGPQAEGFSEEAYAAAVEMYKEREGVENIQFDKWINGYHFIFLNTDKMHSDDCYLSADTIRWLDEKLGENENGKPTFVMVHQPLGKVHVMEGAPMTFEEVIAKHPSAVVSSGHEHADFGTNRIIQEGAGTYVNQPAMAKPATQYYYVEVYTDGIIYRAREVATDSWHVDDDVVIMNENRTNNVVFNSATFDKELATENVIATVIHYDSVSGKTLKLQGSTQTENVTVPIYATGTIGNYAGYAVYVQSNSTVKLAFDGKTLKPNATCYGISGRGKLIEKIVGDNGELSVGGWVIIPKEAINGMVIPTTATALTVEVGATQVVYLDQVSYYFDIDSFFDSIYNLSYNFYDYNGENLLSGEAIFNSSFTCPVDLVNFETQAAAYAFKGWDTNGDGNVDPIYTTLKGNMEARAVYVVTPKQYTYTFYGVDGKEVLSQVTADYGSNIAVPKADSNVFGWDIDGDGAIESIPEILTSDLTAVAVLGEQPYENGEVVYDPSKLSEVTFKIGTYNSPNTSSLIKYNALPVNNEQSPTGKAAQFTYNYTDGTMTHTGSMFLRLELPYIGTYADFQGYAMWVDIPATTEATMGGLKFNSDVCVGNTIENGWTLLDANGKVTTMKATKQGGSDFPAIGTGFTGWVIIDKSTYDAGIEPSESGCITFQFRESDRKTSYTMNIGQIIMYNDKTAILQELSAQQEDNTVEYVFQNTDGYIYKSGQVTIGEEMIIPSNPTSDNPELFFVGWDIDEDGSPDALPQDGKIEKDIKAVALFCHASAFDTFYDGGANGYSADSRHITFANVEHNDSPTGKAVKVSINPKGNGTGIIYAKFNLKEGTPMGIAFWMDASTVPAFTLRLWKNWIAKTAIGSGGDYVYFYGTDGSLSKAGGWRQLAIPANFKGWMIVPMTAFKDNEEIFKGDYIRMAVGLDSDGNAADFSADIYIGEGVSFYCSVNTFMSQIDKSVYRFVDYDGSTVDCGILEKNDVLNAPKEPTQDGYTFIGWDVNGDGLVDELPSQIGRTFKASALYKMNQQFTYKFVDEDGNIVLEKTADYNSLILPPFRYEKEPDLQYTYIASYPDYEEGMRLTEDRTFQVVYAKQLRVYTYTFVVDGITVKTDVGEYGANIMLPEVPAKDADAQYTYVFKGWKGYTDGMTIAGDVIFEAEFEAVAKRFTYTFVVEGQTVLTGTLGYGEKILLPEDPMKKGDSEYSYIFKGWKGYTDGMTITEDVMFEAEFVQVSTAYKVTFYDEDGETIIAAYSVAYGETIETPQAPEKEGYVFKGWNGYREGMSITQNISCIAMFEKYEPTEKEDEGCSSVLEMNRMLSMAWMTIIGFGVVFMRKRKYNAP